MTSPPRVMIFPITMTCNSKCRSCGIWRLPVADKAHSAQALLQKALTDPFLATNIESVNISGGEPFAHPGLTGFMCDIMSSYQRVRELCINTDGHLLPQIEQALEAALPLHAERGAKLRMYISLDGVGPAHDRHRRHPGAFELADRALTRLAELKHDWPDNLRVTASFTITDRNADQIVPVFEYVRDLDLRVDFNLAARPEVFIGGAGLERKFQVVLPEQMATVRAGIRKVCDEPQYTNFSPAFYATMLETLENGRRSRGCFFPEKGFVLMPDGRVYICGTYLEFYFGNLKGKDFEALWNSYERSRCRAEMIPAKCESCFSNSYEDWDLAVGARI